MLKNYLGDHYSTYINLNYYKIFILKAQLTD